MLNKILQRFSNPEHPMYGFHSNGICAYSKDEVMGDPAQVLPKALWSSWCTFELRNHANWRKWKTVWFQGVPVKVIALNDNGGNFWGCAIDTATVIRILRTDLESLRETYSDE